MTRLGFEENTLPFFQNMHGQDAAIWTCIWAVAYGQDTAWYPIERVRICGGGNWGTYDVRRLGPDDNHHESVEILVVNNITDASLSSS